jgi:hypothetical protein
MRNRLAWSFVCVAAAMPRTATAQVPLGPEFQVNTYTTYNQRRPSIASDAGGNFVVAWQSHGQDGGGYWGAGVFLRRYTASGAPFGPETRVNSYTTAEQLYPAVASDPTGRLAVVWSSADQDGSSWGVYGRRYDSSGTPGPEFRVNTYTSSYQLYPAVATDASGNFVVVWESWGQDDNSYSSGIFGQRFDAAGTPQGPEFQVSSYTTGGQRYPSVGMDASGNFVVAWTDIYQAGAPGIVAQRYDATGARQGDEFWIESYTTGSQVRPSVAVDGAGNFVVVWESDSDGDYWGVFGRRYDAAGTAQGDEFPVNTYTPGAQRGPKVTVDGGGNFAVVWDSAGQDGSAGAVYGRLFDAAGAPRGVEFLVNTYTSGSQVAPTVAAADGGAFVVAWTSSDYLQSEDGDGNGVFAQRFAPDTDLIFGDGFESGNLSAWSAAATDGGDLTVSATAALNFSVAGLRGVVDDTAGLYVQDDSPQDEARYRVRFHFDTNGFDPGETQNHLRTRLFIAFEESPTRRLAAVVLRRLGGQYAVMGRVRRDDNSQYNTGFFPISDDAHFVELDWKRSSGADANDGSFEMWLDGISVHSVNTLDNSISAVDFARLGALSVKAGADGTLYWDEFESRRVTYIGP